MVNKLRGALKIAAVKAPGFGDRRKAMLEDIAILTGGTVVSEERGFTLENTTLEMLGTAEKVTIDKDNTTVVNGAGAGKTSKPVWVKSKRKLKNSTSDYDKEKLQERLAKLSGGVAVLYGCTIRGGNERKERPCGRRTSRYPCSSRRRYCCWWRSCFAQRQK